MIELNSFWLEARLYTGYYEKCQFIDIVYFLPSSQVQWNFQRKADGSRALKMRRIRECRAACQD